MEKGNDFYGWKLLGVLWFLYLINMGFPLYGGIIANVAMMKDIEMSRSTFGLGFTVMNFCVGVPSIFVAMVISRWGARLSFTIGALLIMLGGLWMSQVTEPWQYVVGFGVLIGLGQCFCTIVPLQTVLTRWFLRFRGRAIGIALTASGFGGFVGSPVIDKILQANGGNWQQAWLIISAIMLLSGIAAFLFVKEQPSDLGHAVDGGSGSDNGAAKKKNDLHTTHEWTTKEVYSTVTYWLIVLGVCASFYPFFFAIAHLVLHFKGQGVSAADAAWAMGLFTMFSIGGRLIGGWLMDFATARYVMIAGYSITICGSLVALQVTNTPLACLCAALLGGGFGWTYVTGGTMVGNYFGPAVYPKIFGMLMMISSALCAMSGIVGGKLFDVFGSYAPAFQINIVFSLVGAVVVFFAYPVVPQHVQMEAEAVVN